MTQPNTNGTQTKILPDTEGFTEGWLDGCAETLGDSDGIDVGTPVSVGVKLGWLEGTPETEG